MLLLGCLLYLLCHRGTSMVEYSLLLQLYGTTSGDCCLVSYVNLVERF